ncbi:ExbD/TolR family protein [Alloyangia pacifica]|uniref:Biopolymer transport protein ExbD n=1 Tax=Alloyangia pacifica TaxID=311180 RepID=A0A1I6RNC2_9RHOB|nr:biopolymer transporter ExbD [Alloyangia pacifica]SDG54086.1 biopolymer transport protein ExbD [Alloyangia pacifica]SFS66205.1 biopolymer transport protein ExbD [Alloyangia pacifica]
MRRRKQKTEREPTIALINIVFLMLVFFLVAGTVARPLDPALNLVHTADLEGAAPADALVINADGSMSVRGEAIDAPEAFLEALGAEAMTLARIVPDRDLPAAKLVEIGRALRAAGAEKVMIVTERGLE